MSSKTKPNKPAVTRSVEARKARNLMASPMTWVVVLVLVAGVVAIGLAASKRDSALDPSVAQTAPAEVVGTPLPTFEASSSGVSDPAIGMTAPAISAQSLAGESVEFGGDGTARLYGFFAHWCPHCQDELPSVSAWHEHQSSSREH